jgi:hypothetical protein
MMRRVPGLLAYAQHFALSDEFQNIQARRMRGGLQPASPARTLESPAAALRCGAGRTLDLTSASRPLSGIACPAISFAAWHD